jgi:hypothetical protein
MRLQTSAIPFAVVIPRESTVDALLCKNLSPVLAVCTVTCASLRGGIWTALATRTFVDGVMFVVGVFLGGSMFLGEVSEMATVPRRGVQRVCPQGVLT